MAKMEVEVVITQRYWCAAMVAIGYLAVRLGAEPEKIAGWIVKYGMKLEIR